MLTAGCISPGNNAGKPTPLPSVTPSLEQPLQEYRLGYKFEKGVALFHRVRVETTIDENQQPTQIMETVTIPSEINADYSHIKVVMLKAIALDKNGTRDLCGEIAYSSKVSDMNIYIDGKVDYGWTSTTNFYMPQRAIRVGDGWSFEGIRYSVLKASKIETLAGSFDVLEIEFSGKRTNNLGTRSVSGTLYFDYKNGRIVKYVQEESAFAYKRRIEQELIDIKREYSEPDMRCALMMSQLSTMQKYENARRYNAVEDFEKSIIFALSAKQDLHGADLNAETRALYIKILELLADNYHWTNQRMKLLDTRFELGNLYSAIHSEEISSDIINARNYFAAAYNLEFVSNSESANASEAKTKLAQLKSSELGIARGKAILKDSGDNTGLVSELYDGKKRIRFELLGESYYNLPLLNINASQQVALYLYKDGYYPKFIVMNASELISKNRDIILEPLSDTNKVIVAGTCYDENGFVQAAKLFFNSTSETKQVECNGFYIAELSAGDYNVLWNEKTLCSGIHLDANSTLIKHLVLSKGD